jgi:DNA helicase HerA-like ATPase
MPESKRTDCRIYVDEAQAFASPAFSTLLSRGRKYHCSLVLNHQFQAQLDDDTRAAIFGNCGTFIVFSVGAADAELLAQQLGGRITPGDLTHLPKYHAYCSLMIDGKTQDPFFMQTVLPPLSPLAQHRVDAVLRRCRDRYSRPLSQVDAELARQLANSTR